MIRHSRRLLKVGAAAAIVAAFLLSSARPAAAHADLVATQPASGTRVDTPPSSVRLVFTEPVDPAFTRVRVRGVGGFETTPTRVAVAPDDNKSLIVSLPSLGNGPYAITYTTTTTDGHAASGDMLFGIGSDTQLRDVGPSGAFSDDRGLRIAATASRAVWYAGLALLVGGLVWRRIARGSSVRASIERLAYRGVVLGWIVLLASTAVRITVFLASLSAAAPASSVADIIGRVRPTTAGRAWFVLFFVTVILGLLIRRRVAGLTALAALVLCAAEAATGHAATGPSPAVAVAVTAVHLLALAAWGGGLMLLVVIAAANRGAEPLRPLVARFSRLALVAVGVLVGTGSLMAWIQLGGLEALTDSDYGQTLIIKLTLVVATICVGAWHWRTHARLGTSLARTLRLEMALIVAVVVAASVLGSLAPGRDAVGESVLAASANPTTPSACADAAIETAECWQRYFSLVARRDGVNLALTAVKELSATNELVRGECHQLVHTIGRNAFEKMGLREAQEYTTPLCNSGYQHGAIEAAIATMQPEQLRSALPTFCQPIQFRQYSFDHHNCSHGVGHGIATHLKMDVFASTPFCEAFTDPWETQSCYGGVFMQKIVGDANRALADDHADNPVWPCDIVPEIQKDACYMISTGRVLRLINYDYERAFAICDAVEANYVDTCYQSMGRDISGIALFKAKPMVDLCLRAGQRGPAQCIRGAVVTTVDEEHGRNNATAFCEAVPAAYRPDCFRWRNDALAQL